MENNIKKLERGVNMFKFMPNKNGNKVGDYTVKFDLTHTSDEPGYKPHLMDFTFTYLLVDGKIDIYKIGSKFKKLIRDTANGNLYINSNGLVLFNNDKININVTNYAVYDGIIYVNLDEDLLLGLPSDVKIKTDVYKLEHINLYDLRCPYFVEYELITRKVDDVHVTDFINIKLIKKEPVFNGKNQQEILDLYNDVFPLNDIVEQQKDLIILQSSNDDFLFDDEARKYYIEYLQK